MAGPSNSNSLLYTRVCLLCWLLLSGAMPVRSQSVREPVAADLATTGILDDISANTFVCFPDAKNISREDLTTLSFAIKGTKKFEHFIPPSQVNKKAVLKFTLTNSSEAVRRIYFCPGFYYDSIQLFKTGDSLFKGLGLPEGLPANMATRLPLSIPRVLPNDPDSLGYRQISLQPHETATFFTILTFIKSSTNSINPTLTRDNFISQGIILNHKNRTRIDIITNLFAGIMLMMIFYACSQFIQTAKAEFLFYAGYAICISSLLFLKSIQHNMTTPFNFIFEGFYDNIIFSLGYIFYIIFHRRFLETKRNYPDLDRYLIWGTWAFAGLMILFIPSFFLSADFRVTNFIEYSSKILLMILSLIFIWKGIGYRNQLMNYIVLGNISLCVLSIISQIIISTDFKLVKGVSVFNLALFYYEAGITIELLFFLFALTYKNKREIILSIQKEEKLKLETERKELEKQVAVLAAKQDERNRISADMHDELGSGVTAIRLMSEIVKSKMKEQTLPEIEKISHSANELLNKMNTIIWTMTSSNDTVENLVAYVRAYAVEFFENTAIDCYFSMPASIPGREISGEKRRNIFLSIKEALNNVLKHSQGSVVRINVTVDDKLVVEIQDDGVGINMEKLRKFGNGLNNMKKRMASIDGDFNIECRDGTRTTFYLAL